MHINTHDVVIRYLRFRRGNLKVRDDALGGYPVGNVIIDHVSASWGLDENLSLYRHMEPVEGMPAKKLPVENLTIQWSISSEALDRNNHAFGGTWGGQDCSFHHNLFACNTGRNPSIGMGGLFDFRNNVLFNWQHRTIDGGDGSSRVNLVANYFKPGPATTDEDLRHRICKIDTRPLASTSIPGVGKWYVDGNVVEGNPEITADNWAGGVQYSEAGRRSRTRSSPGPTEEDVRASEPFPAPAVAQQSAEEAYELVLAHAGASLPRRDAVDVRVIESVRTGRPTFGDGIIDSPADVGGWPEYRVGPGPRGRRRRRHARRLGDAPRPRPERPVGREDGRRRRRLHRHRGVPERHRPDGLRRLHEAGEQPERTASSDRRTGGGPMRRTPGVAAGLGLALFVLLIAVATGRAAGRQPPQLRRPRRAGRLVYATDDRGQPRPRLLPMRLRGRRRRHPRRPGPGRGRPGRGGQRAEDPGGHRPRRAPARRRTRHPRARCCSWPVATRSRGSLRIATGGVVLRGQGDGPGGTVLVATGTDRRPLIRIEGGRTGGSSPRRRCGSPTTTSPSGLDRLRLDRHRRACASGDAILVEHPEHRRLDRVARDGPVRPRRRRVPS